MWLKRECELVCCEWVQVKAAKGEQQGQLD